MKNYNIISKVRKYFLQNPNDTLQDISDKFNVSKSTIQEYLTNKEDLKLVTSLCCPNLYFLFNSFLERSIYTEKDGRTIINTQDFQYKEKIYLQSFGLIAF